MLFLYIITFSLSHLAYSEDVSPTTVPQLTGEEKMSETIRRILEHFQQPDPVGLPGAKLPDPFLVPVVTESLGFGTTLHLEDNAAYGINNFRIVKVNVEAGDMKAQGVITMEKLRVRGNYTLSTWLHKSQGPYTVNLSGLKIDANANLAIERDGKLRAQDMNIDLSFSTIGLDFQNIGIFFQKALDAAGLMLFNSFKPHILKKVYTIARTEINTKLDEVAGDIQFPNSISPLDMIIVEARKKIREKYEPYNFEDYNDDISIFSISVTNTSVTGLSSFQRVGNITFRLENNTAIADLEIGTQKLEGRTQWEITPLGFELVSRVGTASFSVEYISGRIVLAQPLGTRKRLEIKNLNLEVGNIQVRFNGIWLFDYVIEAAVNILPNLLRYQILAAFKGPGIEILQQELDKINIEEMINDQLYEVDKAQGKLSALLKTQDVPDQWYDEDEFFNF